MDKDLKLTFDQLFSKFTEIYWNLVLKHHILQKSPGKNNRMSALERVLTDAQTLYQIEDGITFESLTDDMMFRICKRVKQQCKENVVGALFADLSGYFYSFSKKEEWIQINPQMQQPKER